MPKGRRIPEKVYVQRVVDGNDSYLLAWDDVEDVDLDNGSRVYVFTFERAITVSRSPRTIEEV